jgi:hypothetical protein
MKEHSITNCHEREKVLGVLRMIASKFCISETISCKQDLVNSIFSESKGHKLYISEQRNSQAVII